MQTYAKAIHDVGGPETVWSFLDGTFRPFARPGVGQRMFYSGHKKRHGIKYQGLVTPDGLISALDGPFYGKIGDWRMWINSGIRDKLRALLGHFSLADRPVIYGDAAYKMGGFGIIGAFTAKMNQPLTQEERQFNRIMSSFRIAVEHSFGRVVNLWQANEFTRGNSAGISAVGATYIVSVLLTNCHTCLHGNQTSQFFQIEPPNLDTYFESRDITMGMEAVDIPLGIPEMNDNDDLNTCESDTQSSILANL